jgi:hypothetical protein
MTVKGTRYTAVRAVVCCLTLSGSFACGHSRPPTVPSPRPVGYDPTQVVATAAEVSRAVAVRAEQPSRQLIRRGHIGVEVSSLATARQRLEQTAGAFGAQVTRATVEDRERAEYVIRVPPERLDPLMDSTATLGRVENRSIGVDDVTDRVIDIDARLGALRASRDRLQQLFDRAATTQEVIAVERELARVQAEIESLEGRLATLRGQVALSELSVALRQRPVLGPLGVIAAGLGTGVRKLFLWR